MRPLPFLMVLPVLLPVHAGAAAAQAPGEASANERPRVLVLTPTSTQVEPPVLDSIASLIAVELQKQSSAEVLSASDVKKMAALEAEKSAMGCDDSSCLAELAGALGARYVIFGDAAKLGTLTVLNLNLFDSNQAKSVGRVSVQAASLEELPKQLPRAVNELVGPSLGLKPLPTQAAVVEESGGSMAPVWTVGTISVGALVGLGGLGFDLVSPGGNNQQIDGFDFVGPSMMVAGVGIAVVGLVFNPFSGGGDDA